MTARCASGSDSLAVTRPAAHPLRRVFLVGNPRSGTTLVQCLLAAHPDIWSVPETAYFGRLVARQRRRDLLGIAGPGQRARYLRFLQLVQPPANVRAPRNPVLVRQYADIFVRVMDAIAEEHGRLAWIEKTPYHIRRIELIERLVPRAQFVHVVRSGTDTIASVYDAAARHSAEKFGDPANLDAIVEEWVTSVRHTLRHARKANHFVVRYEQLVEDCSSVLTELCCWLDLAYDPVMLVGYSGALRQVRTEDETWKASVAEPIRNQNGTKFDRVFTPEQQEAVRRAVEAIDLSPLEQIR